MSLKNLIKYDEYLNLKQLEDGEKLKNSKQGGPNKAVEGRNFSLTEQMGIPAY